LLEAAREAGVETIVFISTLSAFEGCRSLYGRAKLEIEATAHNMGANVIRPGLVYGKEGGGVFGRIVGLVRRSSVVPRLIGGQQVQYLVHENDVGKLVQACLEGRVPKPGESIPIAHERGWELTDIVLQIGRVLNRSFVLVPVPWQLAWLGLKMIEMVGGRPGFRSDSLLGMVYQCSNPNFELTRSMGIKCQPFEPEKLVF